MTWKKIENIDKEDSSFLFFCICKSFMDKLLLIVVFFNPFVGIAKVLKSFAN
jgi:hypothetical protein